MTKQINVANIDKVKKSLCKINKPNQVRLLSDSNLLEYLELIEKKLSKILNKQDWKGLRFNVDPFAETFPSSYKGTPTSTQFQLERRSSGWFVLIERKPCMRHKIRPLNMESKSNELAYFQSKELSWD
ncbi:MAG: hypothetical protein ACJAS1_004715 [Oleiphilaceae bacterium]|jgi:hypothetical protein